MTDFFEAAGLAHSQVARGVFWPIVRPMARRFARQIVTFDHQTGLHGLSAGSIWLTRQFASSLLVSGAHHIPTRGPVIVASNHPGMVDTVALFGSIQRADLKAVAAVRPFLASLGNVSRHLINVTEIAAERMGVVRAVASHLRKGGAIVTFPAGKIEPDPLALPGAVDALNSWAESLGLFARLAPGSQIVPAIVSGVVSQDALQHPVARMRRSARDRERMGVTLQIMFRRFQNLSVRVAFGRPIGTAELLGQGMDARMITQMVAGAAAELIVQPPTDWIRAF